MTNKENKVIASKEVMYKTNKEWEQMYKGLLNQYLTLLRSYNLHAKICSSYKNNITAFNISNEQEYK